MKMCGAAARRQPEREAGGGGGVGFACGGDFVQGAMAEAAAERAVYRRNAERKWRRRAVEPQRGLGSVQLLTQPAEEGPVRFAHRRSFGCSHGLIRGMAASGCQSSS